MKTLTFSSNGGKCYNPSLRLMTKARACKVAAQEEAREWRKVWGNEPSHSQESFQFGSLESQWTFKFLEGDCRGQNLMDWGVIYIIKKLLKHRCLKWARMTHSNIKTPPIEKRKLGSEFAREWICLWLVLAPNVFKLCTNQFVGWFVQVCVSNWCLSLFLNPIPKL
jgi:hypothetical protein